MHIELTATTETYSFVWAGGPYIDVAFQGCTPHACINVWDYQAGRCRVPFTVEAFATEVTEFLLEDTEGE